MKRHFVLGSLVVILAGGMIAEPALANETAPRQATTKSVTLKVEKMACGSCAARVTNVLKQMNGVKDAKVSVESKGAVVEYDPAQVTPRQMADAINAIGFHATTPGT